MVVLFRLDVFHSFEISGIVIDFEQALPKHLLADILELQPHCNHLMNVLCVHECGVFVSVMFIKGQTRSLLK